MGEMQEEIEAIVARMREKLSNRSPEEIEEERRREEEQERREAAEKAEKPFRRLRDCGVPQRIVDTLKNLRETAAVARAGQWSVDRAANPGMWCLVLSADKGVGKSVAAGLWLMRSEPRPVTWMDRDFTNRPLDCWWSVSRFARVEGYDGKFDALCNHDGPIVLDDLGSEYLDGKGWFLQALDAFIDARYSAYRPTLITTNLSAPAFKQRYSERVYDRLCEGGSWVSIAGQSMRRASA